MDLWRGSQHACRTFLLPFLLVMGCQNAFAYDSLQSALQFYQYSQYQKALPIFFGLSARFKAKNDFVNYAICQTKIADIIRNYGGTRNALELLEANQRYMEVTLEVPSLAMAQNYIAKAEAFFGASNYADFKSAVLKSMEIKTRLKLSEKHFAEDFLHLARYYSAVPDRSDSCYYWAMRALKCAKSDKSFSLYSLPRMYNMVGAYYHPASVAYFNGKTDSLNNHFRLSRIYFDSALWAISKQPVRDELMLGKIYHNLGNSFSNQGAETIPIALSYYKSSIRVYEEYGSPADLALKDWVVGRAFERLQLTDSALAQFQQGIRRLVPGFNPASLEELPVIQPTVNDFWFSSLLARKALGFYSRYRVSHRVTDLRSAYDHHVYLLNFNKFLVAEALHENEVISWSHLFGSNAYQLLVMIGYELYKTTGDKSYLKNAYGLLAYSKYAFLNRNVMEPEIMNAMDGSLMREERKLVINNLGKSIPALSESQAESILPPVPRNLVWSTFPKINLAKHLADSSTFNNLIAELGKENAVLIDFYVYDRKLYKIIVSGDTFEVQMQALPDDVALSIEELKKHPLQYSPGEFSNLSNSIYRATLDSALMLAPRGIRRLIICPDDLLQDVPWDALVVDNSGGGRFKSLHYLVQDFTVRTVMTPVHVARNAEPMRSGFYGVAPDFTNSTRFSAIPFSSALVSQEAAIMDGKVSQTLKVDSLEVGILHIASHVTTNSLHPEHSAIHLGEMDSLTIADLSRSGIRANLVVLNGCQTGNGKYVQSEGTISLARVFYLLGAASVVTTLWSVDDKATADILRFFYDDVEEGLELDVAMRNAKLKFIDMAGNDELVNPFYWAGVELTGSVKPGLKRPMATLAWSMGFLPMAIGLAVFLRLRRRRKEGAG